MSLVGTNDDKRIQRSFSNLGDVLAEHAQDAKIRPFINSQMKINLASAGRNAAETENIKQHNTYIAQGGNMANMTPKQRRDWFLRGGALGLNPQWGISAMSQFAFLDAANNPNATPMTEDRARLLYGAQGLKPTRNTRATTEYDQIMHERESSLAKVLQDMQDRSRAIRKKIK